MTQSKVENQSSKGKAAKGEGEAKPEGTEISLKRSAVKIEDFQLPEGFTQVNLDIVGFWNEDCALQCVPQNVKLFDNKIEQNKPSSLITVKVLQKVEARNSDGEIVVAEEGQLLGVWGRPGLRELKVLAGCRVAIVPDGEIPMKGKPHPMRAFKIYSHHEDKNELLKVTLDKREKSKRSECLWVDPN